MNFQIIKDNNEVIKGACVEPTDYSVGFKHIRFWPNDVGMWFEYTKPTDMRFWMKDVIIPLEIAFILNNTIIDIKKMTPGSTEIIRPENNIYCTAALEMPLDWFSKHKISMGDIIKHV